MYLLTREGTKCPVDQRLTSGLDAPDSDQPHLVYRAAPQIARCNDTDPDHSDHHRVTIKQDDIIIFVESKTRTHNGRVGSARRTADGGAAQS